tara:strand:+ start:113 stop:856 length:744 start_codon:yes stop_codon:yes gene_type:complete
MIKDLEFFFKNIFFSEKYLLNKRLKRALKNNYEKELALINKFTNRDKSAVDVGVYRGVYSYKLSQEFKHVYAFEPNPLIYPFLKKNLTKIITNLTLNNCALSNTTGATTLKIPARSKSIFKNNVEELYKLGAATIHEKNNFNFYKSIKVPRIKLDDYLKDDNIGFIKIDVEGHEREVIEGAKNIIIKYKPILLVEIEERHNKKPVLETIHLINQLGYSAFFCKNNELNSVNKLINFNKENNFYFLPL